MRRLRDLRGTCAGTGQSYERLLRWPRRVWQRNPTQAILPKREEVDYCACGACTGLRNTPIPATLTSTASPPTTGPTPAGVPVATTSPGQRVIMREIQRTRNAHG